MFRRRQLIVIIATLLFLVLMRWVVEIGPDRFQHYYVTKIIDGDTAELRGGDKVRLLGIDTPEEGQDFYDSASMFLTNAILHKNVELKFSHRKRDPYGRLLAYVFVDSAFINAKILNHGLGHVYLFPDNMRDTAMTQQLIEAQRQSMADHAGVWGLEQAIIEKYYIGNRSSMRFHRPSCRSVRNLTEANRIEFDSREAALYEGFSPCRNCQP